MFTELMSKSLYQYWVYLIGIFYDCSRPETLDFLAEIYGYSENNSVWQTDTDQMYSFPDILI